MILLFSIIAVRKKSKRLVSYEDLTVLVDDGKLLLSRRFLFRSAATASEERSFFFSHIKDQLISGLYQRLGPFSLSVDFHIFSYEPVYMAQRSLWKIFLEKSVEPLISLIFSYSYFYHVTYYTPKLLEKKAFI